MDGPDAGAAEGTKIHREEGRREGGRLLSSLRLKSATQVWHSESEQWHSIQVARLGKEEKYAIFSSKSPVP